METILGGLIGGILRLIPEGIAFFKQKSEQTHELAVMQLQIENTRVTGQYKIEEIRQQGQNEYDVQAIKAIQAVAEAQAKPTGIAIIDGINALIRPVITLQWVILLYPAALVASFVLAVMGGTEVLQAIKHVFTADEKAICAGIINFWFLNRVFAHVRR